MHRDPASLIAEKIQHLDHLDSRLRQSVSGNLNFKKQQFSGAIAKLRPQLLTRPLAQHEDRLNHLDRQMTRSLTIKKDRAGDRLEATVRLLESLSFRRVLKRGYSIVLDDAGKPISSVAGATAGRMVDVEFSDGKAAAIFQGGTGGKTTSAPKKAPKSKSTPKQGSLL